MTKTKHIPGPWEITYGCSASNINEIYTADGTPIAQVIAVNADGTRSKRAEANAQLIAAAPVMYEMLKWKPIKTAPKDGTKILALNSERPQSYKLVLWKKWISSPRGRWYGWLLDAGPTHWHPIPNFWEEGGK